MKPQARVLHRNEALQMVTDLGDCIENVINIADGAEDHTKILALDTLVLLQTKRQILQCEIARWADCEVQS